MEREQAIKFVRDLLKLMVEKESSDLFITVDFPPAIKVHGKITPIAKKKLTPEYAKAICYALMNDRQAEEFESTKECNFAISPVGVGRFRVNIFMQQSFCGCVVRAILMDVPSLDGLGLPETLKEISMIKRGMVILVGGTGTGKSTSLAAMIDHRNQHAFEHIITVEDPIEYIHPHKNCIITQREVGMDTDNWGIALKNTLRQAPDVILLGEIRDRETMDFCISFSETGHLAMATLHANSSNQALDRIINFFPENRHQQLLMDLSLNLKAVIAQRLLKEANGEGRVAAVEVLLASPLISDMFSKGKIHEIKEIMAKSVDLGMKTFDQALFELYEDNKITLGDALHNADSMNELRLKIKLESKNTKGITEEDFSNLHLADDSAADKDNIDLRLKKDPY